MRSFLVLFILTCYFIFSPAVTHAYDLTNIATTSATATVKAVAPTTGDTTAPSNPILVRPLDGDASGNNKPEFVWQSSSDDNSNTITYTLYLNGVATYLGVSNLGNSAGSNYSARIDGSEVKLIPSISLPDGSYNWYVSAYDLANNTSYSTTWNLTIDTTAPHLTITDIDVYHDLTLDSNYPENFQNLNFDIAGPKDVYFTIHSEAWS
ncbi:MAG: Ig-like domain-containing protein, partial [bacterium]